LHHLAEIDTLDKLVNFFIVVVVTKDQKRLIDIFGLSETHNQMTKVDDSSVDLQTRNVSSHPLGRKKTGPEEAQYFHDRPPIGFI